MDEREPIDDTLSDLMAEPTLTVAEEDRALGVVVGQARRRSRRRRATRASAFVVVVAVALAGIVAVAQSHKESSVQVRVPPARRLSTADVTFAIFRRPATTADQIPAALDHFAVDPMIGARLAISAAGTRLFVYRTVAKTEGEMFCTVIVRASGGGGGCTTPHAIVQFGGTVGIDESDGARTVYGIVPDFVSRVTYEGRDIPIVNNAFLVEDAATDGRVVFSTPDGDKTIDLGTGPITTTTTGPDSPTTETCTAAAFNAPAPTLPKWQRVTHTISVGFAGNPETVDPSFPNVSPPVSAAAAWAASMSHRDPGSYEMFLGRFSSLYPFDTAQNRPEVQHVLAWVIVGHHVPVVPGGGADLVEPGATSFTTAPPQPVCFFGDTVEAVDATTAHDVGSFSERG